LCNFILIFINFSFSFCILESTKTGESKILKGGTIKILECKPGLYTKYKPFLQKDRNILKKLVKGLESKRPQEVQSALLRRYFLELSSSFLIPLERYLTSLMPLQKDISPFKSTPIIEPFNQDNFFKSLEASGPYLTSGIKGDWPNLYKKFFRSPNFSAWYEARYREATRKLKTLHIEALAKADLLQWISNKAEVEIVDLVLKIKEKLKSIESESLSVNQGIITKLDTHLINIISTLPQDLQTILQK